MVMVVRVVNSSGRKCCIVVRSHLSLSISSQIKSNWISYKRQYFYLPAFAFILRSLSLSQSLSFIYCFFGSVQAMITAADDSSHLLFSYHLFSISMDSSFLKEVFLFLGIIIAHTHSILLCVCVICE